MTQFLELRQALARATEHALATIKFTFDSAEDPLCRLDYHCVAHTQGVIERTRLILEAVERAVPGTVGEDGIEVGAFAAASHDVDQIWHVQTESDGCEMRLRVAGHAERSSFERAAKAMSDIDDARGKVSAQPLFTHRHRSLLSDGVMATVPRFGPDGLTQPYLENRPSPVAFAVALADLGEHGMDVDAFLASGDAVFREECISCTRMVVRGERRSVREIETYRKRMVAHAHGQVAFAIGVRDRMPLYLSGFPSPARPLVKALFSEFDASIQAARARASAREGMPFAKLVADMGYAI